MNLYSVSAREHMNFWYGLKRRLSGKDRAWWNYFAVTFDELQVRVSERRIFGRDQAATMMWRDIAEVQFVDGGQGSDIFVLCANAEMGKVSVQVPAEADGGQLFADEMKRRGLFP
jgi:hypothetical protein